MPYFPFTAFRILGAAGLLLALMAALLLTPQAAAPTWAEPGPNAGEQVGSSALEMQSVSSAPLAAPATSAAVSDAPAPAETRRPAQLSRRQLPNQAGSNAPRTGAGNQPFSDKSAPSLNTLAATGTEPAKPLAEPLAPPLAEAADWTALLSEDFEGVFPSAGWNVLDANGPVNGEYFWDDDDYKPHAGLWSAWAANGGAHGVDPQAYYYPYNANSWMVYGPVDLSLANAAELQFHYWNKSETGFDWFYWLASRNGTDFYGYQVSGDSEGWRFVNFDLTNVPTLGDLSGESDVWIAFVFTSDEIIVDEGPFVDDVLLRQQAETPPSFTLSWNNPPETVAVNESFEMTFNVGEVSGVAANGGVSVSFPNLHQRDAGASPCPADADYVSSQGEVKAVSYTGGLAEVRCYDQGDAIVNSGGVSFFSNHLLIETSTLNWAPGDSRALRLDITPRQAGTFTIQFRARLCLQVNVNCSRAPFAPEANVSLDQQGWYSVVRTLQVTVTNTPPQVLELPNQTIDEGGTLAVSAVFTDDGLGGAAPAVNKETLPAPAALTGVAELDAAIAARRLDAGVARQLVEQGHTEALVQLARPVLPPSGIGGLGAGSSNRLELSLLAAQAQQISQQQQQLISSARGQAVARHNYRNTPAQLALFTSVEGLLAYLRHSEVVAIREDRLYYPTLAQSLPLIKQPQAAALGFTGAGASVMVIDTGVNYANAAFGSCSAPGSPGCKVLASLDTGVPDDGALDDNGHGTNVSGIVLGVAPDAKLLVHDVFQASGGAPTSAIILALDWAITNRAAYNIVAINLSLGSGAFTSPCGTSTLAGPIHDARAAGIVVVAAAGNDARVNSVSSPACAPDALSVGAVYDSALGNIFWSACTDSATAADQVACFSNSADFLSMLAPGAIITSAGLSMGGTSQAAPHVAGAVAVLRQRSPEAATASIVDALTSCGPRVTDSRAGAGSRAKVRLDLTAALACLPDGGGEYTASISWGDGSSDAGGVVVSGAQGLVSAAKIYAQDGSYPVTVAVKDPQGAEGSRQFALLVRNLPPVVDVGPAKTITSGDTLHLLATFSDPGRQDAHTATIDWGDGLLEPGAVEEADGNGVVMGTHNYANEGEYLVAVRVTDDAEAQGADTLALTVRPRNANPIAASDSFVLVKDTTLNIPAPGLLANDNDPDGSGLTAVLAQNTQHGTLALSNDGGFTYLPNVGFAGQDSFTYRASDGIDLSAPVQVTVTVVPWLGELQVTARVDGAPVPGGLTLEFGAFEGATAGFDAALDAPAPEPAMGAPRIEPYFSDAAALEPRLRRSLLPPAAPGQWPLRIGWAKEMGGNLTITLDWSFSGEAPARLFLLDGVQALDLRSGSHREFLAAEAATDGVMELNVAWARAGDVNYNGGVDVFDLTATRDALGANGPRGEDLNGDRWVDLRDIAEAARWLGR